MVVQIIALKTGMLDYIFSILLDSKVLCRWNDIKKYCYQVSKK